MMNRRGVLGGLAGSAWMGTTHAAPGGVPIERFAPAPGGVGAPVLLLYGSDGLTNSGRYDIAAQALAAAGYTVFLPRYFDATGDLRADYREIHRKFAAWKSAIAGAIDGLSRESPTPVALAVVGFSLGGALALAISAGEPRVKAVVNFFGFFPEELGSARRLAPTLTLHGDADRIVPVENARRIERRLKELGIPTDTQIYPGEGHGLSARSLLDAGARTNRFLGRYL